MLIVQYSVAFDASTRRPSTSSFPWVSRSSVACSPGSVSGSEGFGSSMADAVTVLSRADVSVGVQGQAAQRAGRPARRDDPGGALGERARNARRDAHPQDSGTVGGNVLGQRLHRLVRFLLRLDDDHAAVAVPGQGDRADPEVLEQGQVERSVILQSGRRRGRDLGRPASTPEYLVQELVDALGQQAHLELLQDYAGHATGGSRLEVEGPLAWLPHRAGHEPVRRVIEVDRHVSILACPPTLDEWKMVKAP